MGVVLLTTGVPGCGKTYVRCARFLVDDFLVNSNGVHYSNFPVNVDLVCEAVSSSVKRQKRFFSWLYKPSYSLVSDLRSRVQLIPEDVLLSWRSEYSGPWDFFKGVNLKGAHIALDEVHNFVSFSKSPDYIKKWDEFLGEIRHRGCTFEALTQDETQVHPVLIGRASLRYELIPAEDFRDPYFRIPMGDWYELKAAFTGFYHKTVFEVEKRKQGRGWKQNNVRRFLIDPYYFRFYNSFNASLAEVEQDRSSVAAAAVSGDFPTLEL